ncbi:ArsR family transcriptional regulator [Natrialbaceae archaeon A-CW3]
MSVQERRTEALAESEVFHILGNDRRRAIVQLLADQPGQLDVSDVATEIAELESDAGSVPNNLYKSVYVSLQQTHLPQLEEDGVIAYDSTAKTIERGVHFEDVFRYVDGAHTAYSPVLMSHLSLCVLGLVVIALAGLSLPVVSSIDPVLSSVLILLAIGASSLYRLLG